MEFCPTLSIFNPRLVESTDVEPPDVEPMDTKGQLYVILYCGL